MTERAPARHRADSRPSTPLTGLTSTFTAVVGDRAATLSRGGVVVAVSSGLMTGMGLPAQASVRSAGDTAQTAAVPLLPAATTALGADTLASTPVTGSTKARVSFERSAFSPAPATAKAPSRTTAATATREIATISRSLARAAYLAARPAPAPVARPAARLAPPAQPAPPTRPVASDADGDDEAGSSTAIVLTDDTGNTGKKDGDAGGTVTPPTAGDTAAVVAIAMRYVGIAYRYGGTTPRGFDCSGFTQYVYRQIGISLPRTAAQQLRATTRISRSQARVGDLVFYLGGGTVGHVGIYLGNGKMIDSPRTGRSVSVRAVYSSNVAFGRV